ncbi:MAG: hypothetical protein ABI855_08965, partial [Bacteroidota bacterium]
LYANGDTYEGQFVKNKKHGKGKYTFKSGSSYEGDFVKDLFAGEGVFYYDDGSCYEGTFSNDLFNGKGVCFYANGDYYVGEFRNSGYEGTGAYYYFSGDKYEGGFTKNQFNGEGIYTSADGSISKYKYENGKVIAEIPLKAIPEPVKAEPKPDVKIIACRLCNGTGKVFQAEVRKSKMMTRDISNGLGPRNFVSYSVSEIVRPAGSALCGTCKGTGTITVKSK